MMGDDPGTVPEGVTQGIQAVSQEHPHLIVVVDAAHSIVCLEGLNPYAGNLPVTEVAENLFNERFSGSWVREFDRTVNHQCFVFACQLGMRHLPTAQEVF